MSTQENIRKEIRKSIEIDASREKIWDAITSDESFRDWCSAFCDGSYFVGDWSEGSKMRFLGPSPEDGQEGGMISEVVEHKPGHVLRLKAVGEISNGEEKYSGGSFPEWLGSPEEYSLIGDAAPYELQIYAETPENMHEFFNSAWDQSVNRIKEISEQS